MANKHGSYQAIIRKVGCTSIKIANETIMLDQVEQLVTALLADLKGTVAHAKIKAMKKVPIYLMFLNGEQKKQILAVIVESLKKETIEFKASAAEALELMIETETEGNLVKENGLIPLLFSMLSTMHSGARKFAFRTLNKLASYTHNRHTIVTHGGIKQSLTEIANDHTQICSDAPLYLLSTLATDPTYATTIVKGGAIDSLLKLLRSASAPSKLLSPAICTVRNLARHDEYARRAILRAGAVQPLAELAATHPGAFHKNVQVDAALVLCELASTKDTETQDLLVKSGIGETILGCMRHPLPEIRRNAILAVERWLYSDDRLTLFAIEFFLTLVQNGVEVSPNVKALLTHLSPLVKPNPSGLISTLLTEIKQRPDSSNAELAKLRSENMALKASLDSAKKHTQHLQTAIAQYSSQTSSQPALPSRFDIASITSIEEIETLELKLVQHRQTLHRKEVSQLQDILQCPVCMDKQKDTALTPCGHALCNVCAKAICARQRKCPVCRNPVEGSGKIFL